jgi:hypothetical protein
VFLGSGNSIQTALGHGSMIQINHLSARQFLLLGLCFCVFDLVAASSVLKTSESRTATSLISHSTRKGRKTILVRKYITEISTADDGLSTVKSPASLHPGGDIEFPDSRLAESPPLSKLADKMSAWRQKPLISHGGCSSSAGEQDLRVQNQSESTRRTQSENPDRRLTLCGRSTKEPIDTKTTGNQSSEISFCSTTLLWVGRYFRRLLES